MDDETNKQSELSTTEITGNHQTAHPAAATVSQPSSSAGKFQISSYYTRTVDRTTDIAGRLPNAVYTLPPHIVQAIIGRAELSAATREALVAECKKFYLAHRQYEESKEVFVDGEGDKSTTITLDCHRLYAEGYNEEGQCGIGSEEDEVTGPRVIRLPPVLQVWHCRRHWFAKTTRGLYAWGDSSDWTTKGILGIGDDEYIRQPRRVPIDSEVLEVSQTSSRSFFRTISGWLGCGGNSYGQLGLGHTDDVTTPTPIPGSEGVTRCAGDRTTFAFSVGGMLACGYNVHGRCGVGSPAEKITTLTPVGIPDDVKGRVDRVVFGNCSTFFIIARRCFAAGLNGDGQLGLGSDEESIFNFIELPVPVDDFISYEWVTIIQSGDTLLACGDNEYRLISTANTPKITTPTPIDLPGPVVKIVVGDLLFVRGVSNIFVQLSEGMGWVGRGRYVEKYGGVTIFTCTRPLDSPIIWWTPVTDEYAVLLDARDSCAMSFARPISNV